MKNQTNLVIDLGIFAAFLVAMDPGITGIPVHEWLSLALAGTIVIHLLLHWDWIIQVATRYFRQLWHSSRLNFLLDLLLFISFTGIMVSGLMISRSILPALNIQINGGFSWRRIHSLTADLSMWLVAIHFGLHWRWTWNMFKRAILSPVGSLFGRKQNKETVEIPVENE
jgi:hypothetical protein